MVGACFLHYLVSGLRRQLVVFPAVIPLLFISEVARMLVILGMASAGEIKWALWFFHDWQAIFQFFFVVASLFGIRWLMRKWWAPRGSEQ
jgi:exosortase/archaeosortase family protein